VSCRTRLTMRAYLQRNSAGADAYGQPAPAVWGAIPSAAAPKTACWCSARSGDTRNSPEVSQDSTEHRMLVSLATDVTSDDRVLKVENRAGTELFPTMYIDNVLRRPDHFELKLRDHE